MMPWPLFNISALIGLLFLSATWSCASVPNYFSADTANIPIFGSQAATPPVTSLGTPQGTTLTVGSLTLESNSTYVCCYSTAGVFRIVVTGSLSLPDRATLKLISTDGSGQPGGMTFMTAGSFARNPDFSQWTIQNGTGMLFLSGQDVVLGQLSVAIWTNAMSGAWMDAANWKAGIIADGSGCLAYFTNAISIHCSVTNTNPASSVGNLSFGSPGAYNWTVSGSAIQLTNAVVTPGISVTQNKATLLCPITGGQGLTKTGAGILALGGANTFSGDTVILDGVLQLASGINRLPPAGGVSLRSNTILDLNGQTQTVSRLSGAASVISSSGAGLLTIGTGGVLSPGENGVGAMTIGASLSFADASATQQFQVAGSAWGQYNFLHVTNGTVALNNATLALTASRPPSNIIWLVVKDNPGTVMGTFNGLSEKATVTVGGLDCRITYTADFDAKSPCGGNDIALLYYPTNADSATLKDFELDTVPSSWQPGSNSVAQTSLDHYKSGNLSLCWAWTNSGATITFTNPAAFSGLTTSHSLGFWVYSETPFSNKLFRAALFSGATQVGSCWYYLDYKGWRPLGMPYSQVGWTGQAITAVQFTAPEEVPSGKLYFDYVNFQCTDSLAADNQQPWVGGSAASLLQTPSTLFYNTHDLARNRAWLPALTPTNALTEAQLSDMADVAARTLPAAPVWANTPVNGTTMAAIRASVSTNYNLSRRNGKITGTPIGLGYNAPPGSKDLTADFIGLHDLIVDNMRSTNQADGVELRQYFIDLSEHLVDQGVTEGNNNVIMDWWYTSLGSWPGRVEKMRNELAAAGLARDMALAVAWTQWSKEMTDQTPNGDTDWLHCSYRYLYPALSLFPDLDERHQRLQALKIMVDTICTRLNNDPFSADGLMWHHGTPHYEYSSYSIPVLFDICTALYDTGYRPAPGTFAILKKYLVATMTACTPGLQMPGNMDARAGKIMSYSSYPTYLRNMAECGTPDNSQVVDPDLAGLYLDFVTNTADATVQKYKGMGIVPYQLDGNLPLNSTWATLHRRDNWLVSIVGMNGINGNNEIYGNMMQNNYGGYARNGSVWVVASGNPPSINSSGFSPTSTSAGWNWCLFPGTTAMMRDPQDIFVPIDKNYVVRNDYSYYKDNFSGATSLENDGILGDVHRVYRYAPAGRLHPIDINMQFNKSVFCFGNRITVITTDIGPYLKGDSVLINTNFVTTLYQNSFATNPVLESCWVDGVEVAAFPTEVTLPTTNTAHTLVDNKGNGYYIPSNQPPLCVTRREQTWAYNYPYAVINAGTTSLYPYVYTTNSFATTYFDHGKIPSGTPGECVYTLVVRTNAAGMTAFASAMADTNTAPYRILQKDANAHILWDRETKTTGYILFATGSVSAPGYLKSISRQCYVMVREALPCLKLSVASANYGNTTSFQLVLSGTWILGGTDSARTITVTTNGTTTTLTIPYSNLLPVNVLLEAPTYYDQWASAYNLGMGSATNDKDEDGSENLLEYALGANPTNPLSKALLNCGITSNGEPMLSFNRLLAATSDVIYLVESTPALSNGMVWSGMATNILGVWNPSNVVEESMGGGINRVNVIPTNSALKQLFMRLEVIQP